MDYCFSYPIHTSVGERKVLIATMEASALLAPDANDPGDWRVDTIYLVDIETDDHVAIDQGHVWWEPLFAWLHAHESTGIEHEWIAHRNAEGDRAIYGVEA